MNISVRIIGNKAPISIPDKLKKVVTEEAALSYDEICEEMRYADGNHPLAMLLVGETTNNKTTWLSVFCEGEEFSRLCLENSLTMNEVKEYVLKTSKAEHQAKLAKEDKIAMFVDKNKIIAQGFQLLHRFETDEGDTTGNI